MGNYKRFQGDYVDVGGYVRRLKANDKIIYLRSIAGAPKTWKNFADGTSYVVPAGKKAKIIYLVTMITTALSEVGYGDAEDSATGGVNLYFPALAATFSNTSFVSISIPAGKYFNTLVTGMNGQSYCYILEEDA